MNEALNRGTDATGRVGNRKLAARIQWRPHADVPQNRNSSTPESILLEALAGARPAPVRLKVVFGKEVAWIKRIKAPRRLSL